MRRLVRFALLALAFLPVVSPLFAEEPRKPDSLAVDSHETKNGIHRGRIAGRQIAVRDPLGLMQKIELSYAEWTLLGEPVEDYLFFWDYTPMSKLAGTELRPEEVRARSPALYASLSKLAPLKVFLRATVNFLKTGQTAPFASAKIDVSPDLPERAGKWQKLSVPGSPEWDDFMYDLKDQGLCSTEEKVQKRGAECLKRMWKLAERIQLGELELLHVEWPETEVRQIVDAYRAEEARTGHAPATTSSARPGTHDGKIPSWLEGSMGKDASKSGGTAKPGAPPLPPFRMPDTAFAGPKRKFDEESRKRRQARASGNKSSNAAPVKPELEVSCTFGKNAIGEENRTQMEIKVTAAVWDPQRRPAVRWGSAHGNDHERGPQLPYDGPWRGRAELFHLYAVSCLSESQQRFPKWDWTNGEPELRYCGFQPETDTFELSLDCVNLASSRGPVPQTCSNAYRFRLNTANARTDTGPCSITLLSGPASTARPIAPTESSRPAEAQVRPPITLRTREGSGPTAAERRKEEEASAAEAARAAARKAEFDERVRKHAEEQRREAEEAQRRRQSRSSDASKGGASVPK